MVVLGVDRRNARSGTRIFCRCRLRTRSRKKVNRGPFHVRVRPSASRLREHSRARMGFRGRESTMLRSAHASLVRIDGSRMGTRSSRCRRNTGTSRCHRCSRSRGSGCRGVNSLENARSAPVGTAHAVERESGCCGR